MAPILVEPLSEKDYELLQQLEALNILRVLSKATPPVATAPRKWAGALSPKSAADWDKHLEQIRNEWGRDI
ncbi:MAG: hypothetical protein EOO56_25585 [Hymenobacter sp.]|nr:MAG: hypothetical protein EOO56_25585 [Hymenobacter sp.]